MATIAKGRKLKVKDKQLLLRMNTDTQHFGRETL